VAPSVALSTLAPSASRGFRSAPSIQYESSPATSSRSAATPALSEETSCDTGAPPSTDPDAESWLKT